MADMVRVRSLTDITVSLYEPSIPINKTFEKRGAIIPFEKDKLIQLFYNSHLEEYIRAGILAIDDKDFLYEVGFLTSPEETIQIIELTPNFLKRCISVMPVHELKNAIEQMSSIQRLELAQYAIEHYNELMMDRIDIIGNASGKNILKAIEQYKADQEG